jgi:hypothetical protein
MGEQNPKAMLSAFKKLQVMLGGKPLTPEHQVYGVNSRCPKCRKMIRTPAYSLLDGTPIKGFRNYWKQRRTAGQIRATCPRCGQSWNVIASAEPSVPVSSVQQIVETVRTEELIGDELRKIDNSATSTSSLRRLRATRRWAKKYDVQIERASTTTEGFELALHDLAGYKTTVEAAIRRNYSIGAEEEQIFEEEIEITVPSHTMVQLRLRWKRLWQEGYVVLKEERGGQAVSIPFRTVIGVTFDQESVDA